MGRLERIETVLLDLDGTLYVGSRVVDGAPEAVRWLRERGLAVRFCTNTDSITPTALADRLTRLGFPATEEELVTPVAVAARRFASASEARVLEPVDPGSGPTTVDRPVATGRRRRSTPLTRRMVSKLRPTGSSRHI